MFKEITINNFCIASGIEFFTVNLAKTGPFLLVLQEKSRDCAYYFSNSKGYIIFPCLSNQSNVKSGGISCMY